MQQKPDSTWLVTDSRIAAFPRTTPLHLPMQPHVLELLHRYQDHSVTLPYHAQCQTEKRVAKIAKAHQYLVKQWHDMKMLYEVVSLCEDPRIK